MVVQRVTQEWVVNQVTWLNRTGGQTWSTAGGDVSSTEYLTFTPVVGDNTLDITDLVREWQAGTPNYGLRISYKEPESAKSDIEKLSGSTTLTNIRIEHSCPCNETCAVDYTVSCDANVRPNSLRGNITGTTDPLAGLTYVSGNSVTMGITFPAD